MQDAKGEKMSLFLVKIVEECDRLEMAIARIELASINDAKFEELCPDLHRDVVETAAAEEKAVAENEFCETSCVKEVPSGERLRRWEYNRWPAQGGVPEKTVTVLIF